MLTLIIILLLDFVAGCGLGHYGWLTASQVFDFIEVCMIVEAIAAFTGAAILTLGSGAAGWKKLFFGIFIMFAIYVMKSCDMFEINYSVLLVPITWIGYAINFLIGMYEGIKEPAQ